MRQTAEAVAKDGKTQNVKTFMLRKLEIAKQKVKHVPYITSGHKKMAVWSDLKEILFISCVNVKCIVVLNALKHQLNYPASEAFMHACTQTEQLLFLYQFIIVTPGTLLVDLNCLKNSETLMKLHDMVSVKHHKSKEVNAQQCYNMSKRKSSNDIMGLPLKVSRKLVPAVGRIMAGEGEGHSDEATSDKPRSENSAMRENPAGSKDTLPKKAKISAVLPFGHVPEQSSGAFIPLALLKEVFPECLGVLEAVAHSYVRRCSKAISDISQCSAVEGHYLNSFLGLQKGYGKSWFCLTTLSLMVSWSEFRRLCCEREDRRWNVLTNNAFLCVLNVQKPSQIEPEYPPDSMVNTSDEIISSVSDHTTGNDCKVSVSQSRNHDNEELEERSSSSIPHTSDGNAASNISEGQHNGNLQEQLTVNVNSNETSRKLTPQISTSPLTVEVSSNKDHSVHIKKSSKQPRRKKTPQGDMISLDLRNNTSTIDSFKLQRKSSEPKSDAKIPKTKDEIVDMDAPNDKVSKGSKTQVPIEKARKFQNLKTVNTITRRMVKTIVLLELNLKEETN